MVILCGSLAEFCEEVPGPPDAGEKVYVCGWMAPHETIPAVYGLWVIVTARKSWHEIVEWRQMMGAPMNRSDRERAEGVLATHFDRCRATLVATYGSRVALNRRAVEGQVPGSLVHLAPTPQVDA